MTLTQTAKTLSELYKRCPHCGMPLNPREIGWFQLADGGVAPVSLACGLCFQKALPRLKSVVKSTQIKGELVDSSKLDWSSK